MSGGYLGKVLGDFILDRSSAFLGVCRAGLSQHRNCLIFVFRYNMHQHILLMIFEHDNPRQNSITQGTTSDI